jgi:hypothetical protein
MWMFELIGPAIHSDGLLRRTGSFAQRGTFQRDVGESLVVLHLAAESAQPRQAAWDGMTVGVSPVYESPYIAKCPRVRLAADELETHCVTGVFGSYFF